MLGGETEVEEEEVGARCWTFLGTAHGSRFRLGAGCGARGRAPEVDGTELDEDGKEWKREAKEGRS